MDEIAYIARQSEGAWSPEWIEKQPIHIRKRYKEALEKEAERRKAEANSRNK